MPNSSALNSACFLNRLALDEMIDPLQLDPFAVLRSLFAFASLGELKELFADLCAAATSEEYSWDQGSPGQLLFFCEQLEGLVEACYLLHNDASRKLRKRYRQKGDRFQLRHLPLRLSRDEYEQPFLVLDAFFHYHSLPEWKQALHHWLEAAASRYSVVENIPPNDLLPFVFHMEKLVEAASLLSAINERTTKKESAA